jgi:tRNA (cytidine/uridine-2'-O-)-methyltransferase
VKVVLFEPQIPQNTGNVVRTCAVTGADLVLVEPLGFAPTDRQLKRAGLDYWLGVNVTLIRDLSSYLRQVQLPFFLFSSKGSTLYSEVIYTSDSLLIFGSETHGLPSSLFEEWPDRVVTLPMRTNQRCLNLSNAVAIALYEAWRQTGFLGCSSRFREECESESKPSFLERPIPDAR